MSSRRKVGVSTATSEAARRQLMQPVPCWEKVWVPLADAPAGSTLKVFKWIKTDKRQTFSDDEEEADEPLAPLPDDIEADEGDDQEDPSASVAPENTSRGVSESVPPPDETPMKTEPKASKPHPLSISLVPSPSPPPTTELDAALQPMDPALDAAAALNVVVAPELQVPTDLVTGDGTELDLTGLVRMAHSSRVLTT